MVLCAPLFSCGLQDSWPPTETMNVHNEIADRTMKQFRCRWSIHCLPLTQNCDSHGPAGVSIPCKLLGKDPGRKTMRRATSRACGAQRRVHAAGPLHEKKAWAYRRPLNVEPLPRLGCIFVYCAPRFGAARSSTPRKSSQKKDNETKTAWRLDEPRMRSRNSKQQSHCRKYDRVCADAKPVNSIPSPIHPDRSNLARWAPRRRMASQRSPKDPV